MERVLDRVYTTFKNLDRDYARSKKTRTEFIRDKFGGDIDVGSVIILDAISDAAASDSQEDIEKLTFVKTIFEQIKENRNALDSLPDFQFTNGALYSDLLELLRNSRVTGHVPVRDSQAEVRRSCKPSIHYRAGISGMVYHPLESCKVLHVYSEYMQGALSYLYKPEEQLELGAYYKVATGKKLRQIAEDQVTRNIK